MDIFHRKCLNITQVYKATLWNTANQTFSVGRVGGG